MADRISQEPVEVLLQASAPSARISQEPVEALESQPAQARSSQESVEVVETPQSRARSSQEAVEALYNTAAGRARTSQEAVEVLFTYPANAKDRLSQISVEVLTPRPRVDVGFIASVTVVYTPALVGITALPFIASVTVVHAPTLIGAQVDVPFIPSHTVVYGVSSVFGDLEGVGPGNGGEMFIVRLAANGDVETATLVSSIGVDTTLISLTGDGGFPTDHPFQVTIDDEKVYVTPVGSHSYYVRRRGMGNTTPATHAGGADVTWTDSYDMAIEALFDIAHEFEENITDSGLTTYPGWLMVFDSSQAYLGSDRYPTHVSELVGVFDAGAGVSGTNRVDAAQPAAIYTPPGASDDCPAALGNPARMIHDVLIGDVGVVRYTNPEATVLDLGPRSVSIQSWFGLKRVDDTDHDVSLTDPNGHVVDTNPGVGSFTGTIHDEWADPIPLQTGIAKDASDAAGFAIPTPGLVPWTTVTMPGTNRFFTYGTPHYHERGWPVCCLAVRQGKKRIPYWESWDWHDFSYIYAGWATDATYAQVLINRNGIVFGSVPEVVLPGPQDIDGPDAYWDDARYYVSASWYVLIFGTPYLVGGPSFALPPSVEGGPVTGFIPVVGFEGGVDHPSVGVPTGPHIEGGSGGGINPPGSTGLHLWYRV